MIGSTERSSSSGRFGFSLSLASFAASSGRAASPPRGFAGSSIRPVCRHAARTQAHRHTQGVRGCPAAHSTRALRGTAKVPQRGAPPLFFRWPGRTCASRRAPSSRATCAARAHHDLLSSCRDGGPEVLLHSNDGEEFSISTAVARLIGAVAPKLPSEGVHCEVGTRLSRLRSSHTGGHR